MAIPIIRIKATNVELTNYYERLIARRLSPIGKYVPDEREIYIEVVLRVSEETDRMHFVSVRVQTLHDSFMAVAAKPNLGSALTAVRKMLRRSMSRGASVLAYDTHSMLREYVDSYTLTL